MTTDASRDVPEGVAEDDAADAGRPSLADWLVVSVRPSQMPPAATPSAAPDTSEPTRETDQETETGATPGAVALTLADPAAEEESLTGSAPDPLPSTESLAESQEPGSAPEPPLLPSPLAGDYDGEGEGENASLDGAGSASSAVAVERTLAADVADVETGADRDDAEMEASASLAPQIFSEREADPDSDPELDEALAVVLLSPAARARRAALARGAFFVVGAALVLFFLGRWVVRRHVPQQVIASAAVPAPPPPAAAVSATPAEPEETLAEEEPPMTEPSAPSGLATVGRGQRTVPPDSTSAAPIVAPAWSVARFPDLPRDVLIACEQAAEQAHSAAPATGAPPASQGQE
jgi:hypothetical protein